MQGEGRLLLPRSSTGTLLLDIRTEAGGGGGYIFRNKICGNLFDCDVIEDDYFTQTFTPNVHFMCTCISFKNINTKILDIHLLII